MAKKDNKIVSNDTYSIKDFIIIILIPIITFFSIQFGFKVFNVSEINISGESMANTFHNGTLLFIKKKSVSNDNIIVFKPNSSWDNNDEKTYIKRIVASESDKVKITKNSIIVNGVEVRKLSDEYGETLIPTEFTVPKKNVFVMGDNYQNSNDSLYEYKKGNPDYLINESQIISTGTKLFSFRYNPFPLN